MADIEFGIKGIKEAKSLLDHIAAAFLQGQQALLDAMIKEGESIAINRVGHIDTGETLSTIAGYRSGDTGFIVAGGNAIWLEFGTGVKRNSKKHPAPIDTGGVTINEWGTYGKGKGKDGWYYPTTDIKYAKVDKNGEYYQTQDGQYIAFTYGIPANFFMFNTAQDLINTIGALAKQNIRTPNK